jgi:hypothetical protein
MQYEIKPNNETGRGTARKLCCETRRGWYMPRAMPCVV